MSKKKWAGLFAILTAAAVTLAGCGGADGAKTADGADKLRFTFVCPIQGNVYWNTCVDGMEKAAEEIGNIDISVVGPTQIDTTQFIKDLDSTIASKPDGIMIMCYDESMIGASIDNATKSGIPVVTIDTDGPNTSRVAYYGTANYDAGVQAGQAMVELTGGKAKIVVETADLSAKNMQDRMNGFLSVVEKEPDMEVLTTVAAADVLEGAEVAQQFLTAYPDISAIFCAEGQGSKGIAKTLVERDLAGKITMVTFDEDEELLRNIEDGVITATVAQDPYTMGYKGVNALKTLIDGGTIEQEVNNVPVTTVTKDNVAEMLKKYE